VPFGNLPLGLTFTTVEIVGCINTYSTSQVTLTGSIYNVQFIC
jgi:hypothetical protein